jgi:hypothetical protein
MAERYIKDNGDSFQEVEAIVISSGTESAGKIPALGPDGKLSITMYDAGSELNIDGGHPDSIYISSLIINGGTP